MADDLDGHRQDRAVQGDAAGRGRFSRRLAVAVTLPAAVLAIGIPVLLADRYSSDAPTAAAGPAASPLPATGEMVPPSLPSGAERPEAASTGTPDPNVIKGMPGRDGCPADAPRLRQALRDHAVDRRLADQELRDIECYSTYAVARTEPATVVFRYTVMTDSWRVVEVGTAGVCDGLPQLVRKHLQRCG